MTDAETPHEWDETMYDCVPYLPVWAEGEYRRWVEAVRLANTMAVMFEEKSL